ncbi:MAG: LacI family DNA-binding transcriptional regulator [Verrucomicrobia bacterium]|nr:LacI family DNA-binding transcriptional regulator [Verrucomicrobiota bacterium]
MAVSQKQIAEKLGVSIALISRVLSGKATEIGIAPDTIERVLKAAEEMGYVPSAAALSLKGKTTRTIGVAVYDFNDPFFGALIKQIQTQAHEHNYSLILAGFLSRIPDGQDLQPLHKYALDGLIVLGSDTKAEWLKDFNHLPVARIGHGSTEEASLKVTVDEEDAAARLVNHLTSNHRKNLICISGPLPAHRQRQTSLETAATNAGLQLETIVSDEKDPFTAGLNVTQQLLAAGSTADTLICTTDLIAMGALHALRDAGVSVPEQIAVTGFDDIPTAAQFIPPITTIHQPIKAMVLRAFQAVIEPEKPQTVYLPGTLVIRETA